MALVMFVLGMGLTWAAYAVGSYGWVLLKGWNITFLAWVTPLHPYTFPADGSDPPAIPQGRVWPQRKGGVTTDQASQLEQDVTPGAA